MKRGKIFIIVIIVLSLSAVLFIKLRTDTESPEPSDISKSQTASKSIPDMLASLNILDLTETNEAPDFELPSLEGENIRLGQFYGKAVMLSFWSTW